MKGNFLYLTLSIGSIFLFDLYYLLESFVIRARNFIYPFFRPSEIEIIEDGILFHSESLCEFLNDITYIQNHDFIIYTDYKKADANPYKIVRVNKLVLHNNDFFKPKMIERNCQFNLDPLVVTLPGKGQYPIYLSSPYETFYVVGNKINKSFIIYLLKKQHNIILDKQAKYSLEFIDNESLHQKLDETVTILLDRTVYQIII